MTHLTTCVDAETVARRASSEIARHLEAIRAERGVAHLALSGGGTPTRTYELLAGEPVDWMMEQAGSELFMFSSDYPHPEGGRDPLAKFEETLTRAGESDKACFYASNMAELLGPRAVAL